MLRKLSTFQKGLVSLIALTAIFALLSVLARYLNDGFTILQQVYLRVFVAIVLSLIVFYPQLRWRRIRTLPLKEWLLLAFRGLVSYGIGVTLISKAATLTLIGNVAFIGALPFVPLLGFILLKDTVTWWKVLFILTSFLGVCMLAVRDPSNVLSWGTGDTLAIIATLGFALGYISRRWHSDALNNQEITTLTFVFGALFVFLGSVVIGEGLPSIHQSTMLWLVILLGGILNVANLFLVNYSFEHVDSIRAGNLLNLESAWGLLFGLLFFHELPTIRGFIGGVIIILSVIGMNMYGARTDKNRNVE